MQAEFQQLLVAFSSFHSLCFVGLSSQEEAATMKNYEVEPGGINYAYLSYYTCIMIQ